MATFAPEMPVAPLPDYKRGYSEPITQPEADKSKAITLNTFTNVADEGIQAAEYQDKYGINEQVRQGVDSLRDTTTAAYEQIRNAQMTGQPVSAAAMKAAGFNQSLLGQVGADVPPGLQQGLQQAGVLGTALSQGGATKVNDTLYTGQLNALAKKLRAQYPGHKDYIDQEVSKISGVNPANAYMSNLLQDINRNAVAANSGRNRLLSLAYSHEVQSLPGVLPYIKAFEMGLPGSSDNLESFINKNLSKDYIFKEWQRDREVKTAQKTDQTFDAKQQLQQEASTIAYRNFNSILQIPGLTSPAMIQKMVTDSQNGVLTLTPQQHNQLLSAAVAAKNSFMNEVQKTARDRGYTTAINDPAAEKAIIDNESQQFDRLIDSIKNKEYGTLFEAQRNLKAIQDGTKQTLMEDKDMGAYWRTVDAVTQIGGPNWANRLDSLGAQRGYLGNLQTFVSNASKVASTPDDLRKDGQAKSMYEHLRQLQQYQKQGGQVDPRAYKDIIHFTDLISDPKTPDAAKEEIAKYAFNENNFKTLNAFKMDFTDSQGKFHEGKYSVFDTLTAPGVTQQIAKMSTGTKNMYTNWGETSFAQLYREDLGNLSSLGVHPGLDMRVLWDSTNNRFSIDNGKDGGMPKPHTMVEDNYLKYAQKVINRVNSGLQNLTQVEKLKTSDPTAISGYLLNTMQRYGFDPEHVEGFGADVYEAIKNSKAKKDLSTAFEKVKGEK